MSENFTIQQLNFKLRKALNEQKITELTEIQSLCIPQIIEGHNVSGGAKTGTGKTLAYLIPVYEYLLKLSPEETHDLPRNLHSKYPDRLTYFQRILVLTPRQW